MVTLGTFKVSWVNDQCPLPCSELTPNTSTRLTLAGSFSAVLSDFKVSWMTNLCQSPFPELASLDNKFAWEFFSLGTSTSSNVKKVSFRSITYLRYEAYCGSLAWYSPVTCPVTSNKSLFTSKLWAPNSLASNILTIKASYSAWLLLTLKANLKAWSINNPLGPSRMTPDPLPC